MAAEDVFGEVFSSEGFSRAYTRKLKPPTRGELEAERTAHAATANPLAVWGFVPDEAAKDSAPAETTKNPDASAKVDEVKAMSKEERDSYMDALFSVQYENGEYETTKPVEDEDDWGGE